MGGLQGNAQASGELERAVVRFKEYIAQETLGQSLEVRGELQSQFSGIFDVGEGQMGIGISRI